MAKKDCSELAQAILDLAMNIATDPNVKNLDDVIAEIQKKFPIIPRQDIVNGIVDASAHAQHQRDDLAAKLTAIKREARTDKSLNNSIDALQEHLETGTLPPAQQPRKVGSDTIEQLRSTRDNLSRWLKTADPAMRQRLTDRLQKINAALAPGELRLTERQRGKLHESLKELQNQIDAATKEKAGTRARAKLEATIEELEGHLEAGTIPETQTRAARGTTAIDLMRDVRDDLRRQISKSEPTQLARINKQIADLDARIEAGDILPAPKIEAGPESKELQKARFQLVQKRQIVQNAIASQKPRKWYGYITEPFDVVRDILTTGEFSPVLRQGAFFVFGHPIKSAGVVADMFKMFASEQTSYEMHERMMNHSEMPEFIRSGGHISEIGVNAKLSQREEIALSRLFYQVPGLKAFTRAGVGFINHLRFDMYLMMKANIAPGGEVTAKEAKYLALGINEATGRGTENGAAIAGMNRAFFSPQFNISRFKLASFHPIWRPGTPPSVRKAFAKEYLRFMLGLAGFYLMGWMAGGEMEWDRRSSDFGKIRFGKHRIDPLAGLSQVIVLSTRLWTGETKSTKSGKITPLRGPKNTFTDRDISDVINTFVRSKVHPLIAIPWNIAAQENVIGQPTTPGKELLNATHPITWQDIYEVSTDDDTNIPTAAFISLFGFFGSGVQTYQDNQKKITYTPLE